MFSKVRKLMVVLENDEQQDSLVYYGDTKEEPSKRGATSVWNDTGTHIKFHAAVNEEGSERFQSVTMMKEYSGKSTNELRLEDYQKHGVKAPMKVSSKALFGQPESNAWTRKIKLDTLGEKRAKGSIKHREPFGSGETSWFKSFLCSTTRNSEPMSTDEEQAALPTVSTHNFTMSSPLINFVKAKDLDPATVFKSSSPRCATNKARLLTASESKKLVGDLFETLIKCMQIQNALYRLLLIKTQRNITSAFDQKNADDSDASSSSSVSEDGEGVRSDLQLPLEALVRCGDIQRAIFQNFLTVCMSITRNIPDSSDMCTEDSIAQRHRQECRLVTKEIMFDTVQSQLEDIAFKKKKRCNYARNPFSNDCVRASSQDVMQHDFNNKDETRKLPDGHGTLETLTGQVVYKGEWRDGKRHGKGEALIVCLSSNEQETTDHGFYTGSWKQNMRHGTGRMVFSSGAVYEGQWQYDQITGHGTLSFPDGSIQEGTWREGSLDGCVLFTWPHGVTEYRQYKAGQVQLTSCAVSEDAAKKVSRLNAVRSQISHLEQCVGELKQDRNRLLDQFNKQTNEQAKMADELNTALNMTQQNFERISLKQQERHDKSMEEKTEIIAQLLKDLEESRNAQSCQICFEERRNCIIMPCMHLLYCRKCVNELKKKGNSRCPVCRGPISGEVMCNIDH